MIAITKSEFKQLARSESKDKSEPKDAGRRNSKRSSTIPASSGTKEKTEDKKEEGKKELAFFKSFIKKNFKNPKHAFDGFDQDGSKAVDLAEFTQILKLRRYPGDAEKVFEQLDKNKDGDITWEEFRKQIDNKGMAKEEMRKHFDKLSA
eukprot:gnl/MRDRNA2_/MRDRNA2_54938_c0_seq2.p1 gnl/MRDRNA2_/MRDRNA2_54938_c0~~gnl/MRDRNA2_/MRDRNA2_54938_c0_seq2.p1  ORF type:complete len:149 (+),score=40.67 gnl/MRDRNA2_/MRDRNA2_54938_c0_seq2:24-470(+)